MRHWFAIGFMACVACAKILGADFDHTHASPSGGGGAPMNDGDTSDVDSTSDAGSTSDDGSTDGGLPADCTVLHVSLFGDDDNSGCASELPKKTIQSALEAARSSPQVSSIRICAGQYDEHVILDTEVDLLGGWSCTSWSRPAEYGFPTFDPVVRTTVGDSALPETLQITSAAGESLVDGLTILGSASDIDYDGVAVRIGKNAKPRIKNCYIQGGKTFSIDADGSVGVRIEDGATPELGFNRIDGGSGWTNSPSGIGRVGIVVESASPFLHDNEVFGGKADPQPSKGLASVGLVMRGSSSAIGERAIRDNVIHGGDGMGPYGFATIASIGVWIVGDSSADIVGCTIEPGRCVGTGVLTPEGKLGTAVELRGVQFVSTGTLKLVKSRIYGGNISNPDNASEGFRVGAWVEGASTFLAENTIIHAGAADRTPGDVGSPNFALALNDIHDPVVRHSTMYSGPSGWPTVGTALKLNPNVRGLVLENSVLAADTNWNEPLYVEECATAGVFARVRNNLLFNVAPSGSPLIDKLLGYGETPQSPCGSWMGFPGIDDLESHLTTVCPATGGSTACTNFGGTKASGNVTLRADCLGDLGCIDWDGCGADSLTCLESVFSTWTHDDNGYGALFAAGWALSPSLPCSVAKSSLVISDVSVDLLGTARTSAPSMGAQEQDGCVP